MAYHISILFTTSWDRRTWAQNSICYCIVVTKLIPSWQMTVAVLPVAKVLLFGAYTVLVSYRSLEWLAKSLRFIILRLKKATKWLGCFRRHQRMDIQKKWASRGMEKPWNYQTATINRCMYLLIEQAGPIQTSSRTPYTRSRIRPRIHHLNLARCTSRRCPRNSRIRAQSAISSQKVRGSVFGSWIL